MRMRLANSSKSGAAYGVGAALERLEAVASRPPDLKGSAFDAEGPCCRLYLADLQHAEGIVDIANDRQSTEIWHNLSRKG